MINYLNKLGLTKDWIDYGILSHNELKKLYIRYLESEDKNSEHYRYELLKKWILEKSSFSKDKWNIFYFHIFPNDDDRLMIESVLISLVKQDFLDDSDLQMILNDSCGKIYKEVKRKILLNKIKNQKCTISLIKEIVDLNDNIILLSLVDNCYDDKCLYYMLDNIECPKKIRNIIKNKLGKK